MAPLAVKAQPVGYNPVSSHHRHAGRKLMSERGVLLVNLGSPASTEVADVRRYLNQFLMDPCVVDLPWLPRRLLVSLILLRRPKASAEAYASIWWEEGSPLVVI